MNDGKPGLKVNRVQLGNLNGQFGGINVGDYLYNMPARQSKSRRYDKDQREKEYEEWSDNLSWWDKAKYRAATIAAELTPYGAIARTIDTIFGAREGNLANGVDPLRRFFDYKDMLGSAFEDASSGRVKEIIGQIGLTKPKIEQAKAHQKIEETQRLINDLVQQQQSIMGGLNPDYVAKNRDSNEVQGALASYDQISDQIIQLQNVINDPTLQELDREYKRNYVSDSKGIVQKTIDFLSNGTNPFTAIRQEFESMNPKSLKQSQTRQEIHRQYMEATRPEREQLEYEEALSRNYAKQGLTNRFGKAIGNALDDASNIPGYGIIGGLPIGPVLAVAQDAAIGIENDRLSQRGNDWLPKYDKEQAISRENDFESELSELQKDYSNRINFQDTSSADLWTNFLHTGAKTFQVSDSYRAAKEQYQDASLLDPRYWMYEVPGMVGTSNSSPEQLLGQILQYGSQFALASGNPVLEGVGIAGVTASQALSYVGAMAENRQEAGDKYLDNIASILENESISGEGKYQDVIQDLYKQSQKHYKSIGWTDSDIKKTFDPNTEEGQKNLLGDLVAGVTKSADPAVLKAAVLATKGLQAQYDANMMRTASEIPVQTLAMTGLTPEAFLKKTVSFAERALGRQVVSQSEKRLVNKVLQEGSEVTIASGERNMTSSAASRLSKDGMKYSNGYSKTPKTYAESFESGYDTGAQIGDALGLGFGGRVAGGAVGGGANVVAKAIRSSLPGRVQGMIDTFGERAMYKYQGVLDKMFTNNGSKLAAKYGVRIARNAATDALSEGAEEGVQYLNSLKNYAEEYGWGGMSLGDMIATDFMQGTRVANAYLSLLGLTNSELKNDAEFWNNVKGGFALGGLHTGVISAITETKGAIRQYGTDQIISTGAVMNREADKMERASSTVFAKVAMNKQGQELIQSIQDARDHDRRREQPVNEEQVYNDKLEQARGIIGLTQNKQVREMLEALGFEYGTDRYATAISDIYTLHSQRKANDEESALNNQALRGIYSSKEYQDALDAIVEALPMRDLGLTLARAQKINEYVDAAVKSLTDEAKAAGEDINSKEFSERVKELKQSATKEAEERLSDILRDNIDKKTRAVNKLAALLRLKAQINKTEDWYKATQAIGLKTKRPDAKYIKNSIDQQIKSIRQTIAKMDPQINKYTSDADLLQYVQTADNIILYGAEDAQQYGANMAMLAADRSVIDQYYDTFTEGLIQNGDGSWVYSPEGKKTDKKLRENIAKMTMERMIAEQKGDTKKMAELDKKIAEINTQRKNKKHTAEDPKESNYQKRITAIREADAQNRKIDWLVNDVYSGDAVTKLQDAINEEKEKVAKAEQRSKEIVDEIEKSAKDVGIPIEEGTVSQERAKSVDKKAEARRRIFRRKKQQVRKQAKELKKRLRKNRRNRLSMAIIPFQSSIEAVISEVAITLLAEAKYTYYSFAEFVNDAMQMVKQAMKDANGEDGQIDRSVLIKELRRQYRIYRAAQIAAKTGYQNNMDDEEKINKYSDEPVDETPSEQNIQDRIDEDNAKIDDEISQHSFVFVVDGDNHVLYVNKNSIENAYTKPTDEQLNEIRSIVNESTTKEKFVELIQNKYPNVYSDSQLESLYEYKNQPYFVESIWNAVYNAKTNNYLSMVQSVKRSINDILSDTDTYGLENIDGYSDFVLAIKNIKSFLEGKGFTIRHIGSFEDSFTGVPGQSIIYGNTDEGNVEQTLDILATNNDGEAVIINISLSSRLTPLAERLDDVRPYAINTNRQSFSSTLNSVSKILSSRYGLTVTEKYILPIYLEYGGRQISVQPLISFKNHDPYILQQNKDVIESIENAQQMLGDLIREFNNKLSGFETFPDGMVIQTMPSVPISDDVSVNQQTFKMLSEKIEELESMIDQLDQLSSDNKRRMLEEDVFISLYDETGVPSVDETAKIDHLQNACRNLDVLFSNRPRTAPKTQQDREILKQLKEAFVDAQMALIDVLTWESPINCEKEMDLISNIIMEIAQDENLQDLNITLPQWWANNILANSSLTLQRLVDWISFLEPRLMDPKDELEKNWYSVLLRYKIQPFLNEAIDQFDNYRRALPPIPSVADQQILKQFPENANLLQGIIDRFVSQYGTMPEGDALFTNDQVFNINHMGVSWRDLYDSIVGGSYSRMTDAHCPSINEMSRSSKYWRMSRQPDFLSDVEIFTNMPQDKVMQERKHKTTFNFYMVNGQPKISIIYGTGDNVESVAFSFDHIWQDVGQITEQNEVKRILDQERILYMNNVNQRFKNKLREMLNYLMRNSSSGYMLNATFTTDVGSIHFDKKGVNHIQDFLFGNSDNQHNLYTIRLSKDDRIGLYRPLINSNGESTFDVVTGDDLNTSLASLRDNRFKKGLSGFIKGALIYFYKTNTGKYIPVQLETKTFSKDEAQALGNLIHWYASGYTTMRDGTSIMDLLKQRLYIEDSANVKPSDPEYKDQSSLIQIVKSNGSVIIDGILYNTQNDFGKILQILQTKHQAIDAKRLNVVFGNDQSSPIRKAKDYFASNPGAQSYKLPNGLVINRSDFRSVENNAQFGTTWLGYLIRNGLVTSTANMEGYRQLNIQNVQLVKKQEEGEPKSPTIPVSEIFEFGASKAIPTSDNSMLDPSQLFMIDESGELADAGRSPFEQEQFVQKARDYFDKVVGKGFKLQMDSADMYLQLAGAPDRVLGCVMSNIAIISRYAPTDTIYHEAFHVVLELIAPDDVRQKVYDRYRKANGANLTEREVAEGLADMFVDYMAGGSASGTLARIFNNIKFAMGLLSKYGLMNAIRMTRFLAKVNSGKFANTGISEQKENDFKSKFGVLYHQVNGQEFKHLNDSGDVKKFVEAFAYQLLRVSGYDPLDPNPEAIRVDDTTMFNFEKYYPAVMNKLRMQGLSDEQIEKEYGHDALRAALTYREIFTPKIITKDGKQYKTYPKFDALRKYINDYLQNIFGDSREIESDPEETAEDSAGIRNDQYDAAAYHFSRLDSATKKVKIFFGTIPRVVLRQRVDKDGKGVVDSNGKPVLDRFYDTKNTFGPSIIPMREVFGRITADLNHIKSIQDLMREVEKRSYDNAMYSTINLKLKALYKNAYNEDGSVKDYDAESFLINIASTISGQDIDFVVARSYNQGDGRNIIVNSSSLDRDSKSFSKQWSQFLATGQVAIFAQSRVNGNLVLRDGVKPTVMSDVAALLENVRNAAMTNGIVTIDGLNYDIFKADDFNLIKDEIIRQLNKIGIIFTRGALDYMLECDETLGNNPEGIAKWLMPGNEKSVSPFISKLNSVILKTGYINQNLANDMYTDSGFVMNLAEWQGKYNRITIDKMALGLNGKRLYSISQNSSLSYLVSQYNMNDANNDVVRTISSFDFAYQKDEGIGSIIMKAIMSGSGPNIQAHTYIGFKTDNYGDNGSEYQESSEIEDYMAKYTMLQQGWLIMPTLADKGTYVVLSGISIPGMVFGHDSQNNNTVANVPEIMFVGKPGNVRPVIRPSDQVLDQMIEYAKTERRAIQKCMEDLGYSDIPGYTKTRTAPIQDSQKIANYHTPNKDKSTGKIVEPNGTRFTSFTNLVRLGSDNEPIVENLNDPNKSSVELLKLADRLFFNLPIEDQRTIMALTLAQQNAIGIQKAIDLGIIRRVDRTIGNIKISHTSNSNYNLESSHLNKIQIQAVTDAIYRRLCERYSNWNDDDKNSIHGDARARVRERKSLCRGLAIAALISDVENRSIISSQEALRCFVGHPGMFKIDYDFANGRIKDSTADLQKRIGGLVSTGDDNVVGIPGLNTQYNCAEIQDYKVSSPLYENGILHQMFKNGELREVYAILTDDWDSAYSSSLEDIESYLESIKNNPEAELAVKNAYKHIEEFTDSYKDDIDVADGSAFISAEMCKNLLRARGALTDRVKKAFDILTNDNTKYSWKESADAYRTIYNAVNIVTTKYTAYGFRSHTENGVDVSSTAVPYYNKFALFPIFPCIATGKMQALYQKMLEQNVDMVMMQSAVKVGQQGAVKFNGNEIEGDFNVYSQNIGFLRRQLNTDPEEDDFIKAGSQMQKIGLQNLRLGRTYTDPFTGDEISGDDLLAEYMGAVNDLAKMGAEEIREKFFTNGRPDQEKISKYLKDELSSRNANAQLLKALDIDSSTGQMKSPLSATSSSEWIESIIISTVNKAIIDITTPGSSFIQRSVFAMEGSSTEGGSIQTDSNMDVTINNGNKLQMINEDGSMDAVISIDYFDHIIPKEIKGFNARKQWLMYHNIIGTNAKALTIAYRIPTQAQSSIHALRFVDVIPAVKSTIIVPEEFTKITGSDFDIDHLYLASYNINTTGTDTYDIWGGISEKQHAQNTILHMLMILLHDSKNSGHILYKSIDNDTQLVKKPAGLIPETSSVKHIAYNFGTLHEQVERKKDFITGKTGIGPFALNVTNNILCRLFGVSFRESEVTKNTRLGALYNLVDKDFNSIDAWFSAFINAHVDIVKDPYISKLNVNPYTYNIISLMIRSGFGDTTLWFCSQPIIRDMANAYNMASSQFIRNSHESLYKLREKAVSDAVIKHIGSDRASADQIRKYTDPKNTGLKIQAINWIDNHSDVLKYFATHPNATEYNGYTVKDVQTAVFYAWKVLEPYSMALNSLVQYTKIDTRKQGKNLIEMQVYLYNYHKLRNPDKTKLFDPQSIADLCDDSWIDKKTELAIGLPSEIFSGELFNANSLFVRGCIEIQKLLTGKQEDGQEARINSEFVSDISKQIQTMIKSNWIVGYAKNMKSFNSNMENHTDETLTGLFYGPWTIQFRLNCLHDAVRNNPNYTRLADNYLIQHLVAAKDETDIFIDGKIVQRPKFVTVTDTVADSSVNGDLFSEAWLDLMNDPDMYIQRFARDLAIYAFLTSGEGKGWNQMWKYVPFEFLNGEVDRSDNNSTFVEFVRDVLQYNIFDFSQAATDLIVGNNFMDYRYAKRSVEGFTLKRYDDGTARGNSVSSETFDTLPKYMTVSISGSKKGQQSYALYRKLEVPIVTEDGQLIPVYEVVRKRGYQERNGFHIYEYGWDFKYPGNTNVQETHSVSPQTDPDDGGSPNGIDAMAAINNSGEGSVQNSTPWLQIVPANKTAQRAKDIGGVDTLRHPDENGMHFGNPFSHLKREVESGKAKILTANVKQAVDLFRQWLEGTAYQDVEPERRQWILDKINSGELKDKVFVYYTNNIPDSSYGVAHYDMEHPSHAHVLKQFVDAVNVSNDDLQNTPVSAVESTISTVGYKKDDPQAHKDTAYIFTENAQANAAALELDDSWVEDGYPKGDMVKTGVSDMNGTNQAGVRASTNGTYGSNNINSNAFGIIVKKYQQKEGSTKFLQAEGQFKDTDADFELFKTANLDMFKRLEESGLKKIMWPSQMGLGKAALPLEFAQWLQGELNRRFGIVSKIQKNPRTDYEGYGLQLTSINTPQLQQTPQSNTSSQPIGTKENPVMIYCDGSDKKGTGKIGYGSVFVHNGKEYVLSGTENGEEIQKLKEQFPNANFSNPTTELLATTITLETIANSGIGEHIHINQDYKGPANWGELWNYSEGSAQREEEPWNTRMPYIKHLVDRAVEAIHKIEQNGGSVKIGWVRGHQKSETEEAVMNNIADRYAKNRDEINTLLDAYNTEQENLYEDWTYEEDSLNSGLFDDPNSTTYSDKC